MKLSKDEKIYKIKGIKSQTNSLEVYHRLLDFGFYEGMTVKIIRRLALNGAWILQADSLYIALRDEELELLDLVEFK